MKIVEDLTKGFPFLKEMKIGYKISTAIISWIQ